MPDLDLQRIHREAGKATPGPWEACPHLHSDCRCTCGYTGDVGSGEITVCYFGHPHAEHVDDEGCGCRMSPVGSLEQRQANGQHIANCSPEVVQALVERVWELEQERDAFRRSLQAAARGWGWWNPEDPPIVRRMEEHPAVQACIAQVRAAERARNEALRDD